MDGIRLERDRVSPLRARADVVVDTSVLKPQELKRLLTGYFGLADRASLGIFVTSFSFRQGTAARGPIWCSTCAFSTIPITIRCCVR